jgi:predicted transcriptional regulator
MTTETKVLTAHIPIDLAEKVDRMAERLERSRGWIVKQALVAWLADEEERDRLTREALDDVTEGRLIDDRSVQAWAATLGSAKPRRPPG